MAIEVAVATIFAGALWWFGLAMVPEPVGEQKPLYRSAARNRPLAVVALMVAAAVAWLVLSNQSPGSPPAAAGLVLAVGGSVVALVDAAIEWIPTRLAHGCTAVMLVAVLASAAGQVEQVVVGVVVAAAVWVAMAVVWRLTGAFGFSDVRIIPVMFGPAALVGVQVVFVQVLLWSVLLLLHAVGHRLATGRQGRFPWAPTMLLSAVVVLAST